MRKLVAPAALGLVLLLSACTPTTDAADSAPASTTKPTPSATAQAPASSPPTPSDAAESPSDSPSSSAPADEAINTTNLYDLCISMSASFLAPGDPANVSYAPRNETTTLVRDDGYAAIYIEIEDGNNTFGASGAHACIAKGTVSAPDWYLYGVTTRAADAAQIDAQLRAIISA